MSNPVTPLSPLATANQELYASREGYVKRVLIALDMFGAALFGANNDQTISSDAAIAAVNDKGFKRGYGRTMSAILDLFQRDHGAKAVAGDEERAENAAAAEANSGLIAICDSRNVKPAAPARQISSQKNNGSTRKCRKPATVALKAPGKKTRGSGQSL